jgi:hypothetical protein
MDAALGRARADVRRAVALAHALPRCIIALEAVDGTTMQVGFRRDACVQGTPCDLREAVRLVLEGLTPEAGLMLLGVPLGHVGLGLYRYRSCEGQGFVFASLAPVAAIERRLRDAIGGLRAGAVEDVEDAIEHAEVRLVHDPAIDVSLVFVEFPPLPFLVEGSPEERAAIAVAAGCLAEELARELASRGDDAW